MKQMEKYSPTKGHLLVSPLPTKPQTLSESSTSKELVVESVTTCKLEDQPRSSSNTRTASASRGRGINILKNISTSSRPVNIIV